MHTILKELRQELKESAREEVRISGLRFFKEAIPLYGIKSAQVKQMGKKYLKRLKDHSKSEILDFCQELWQSGFLEESTIACLLSYSLKNHFIPEDFETFERWIYENVRNWAACDTLCNHTVGEFLEQFPHFLPRLQIWSESKNLWVRRASAVSLIIPAKKGFFLPEILQIATLLLLDSEDLVQKGYGWLLKSAATQHEQEIFEFVMRHKAQMPRTALRYAIEKMPLDLKKKAMA